MRTPDAVFGGEGDEAPTSRLTAHAQTAEAGNTRIDDRNRKTRAGHSLQISRKTVDL
jgi:hypothetical protein